MVYNIENLIWGEESTQLQVLCFFFLILKSLILTCVPKHEPPSHLPPHNISVGHPHNYKAVHVYKDLSSRYCVPLGTSFDISGSHLPLL